MKVVLIVASVCLAFVLGFVVGQHVYGVGGPLTHISSDQQPRYSSVINTNQGRDWRSNTFSTVLVNPEPVRHKAGVGIRDCDYRAEIICFEESESAAVRSGGEDTYMQPGEVCDVRQGDTFILVAVEGDRVLVELQTGEDTGRRSVLGYRCPWGAQFYVDREFYDQLRPTRAAEADELIAQAG